MKIIAWRKIFYTISGILFIGSISLIAWHGLNLGSDFTGDAVVQVQFEQPQDTQAITQALESKNIRVINIAEQDSTLTIRTNYLTEQEHQVLIEALRSKGNLQEKSFVSTGPTVGKQLRRNSFIALTLALIAIILYVAWAFRQVSKPVSSWIYGIIAVIALFHDVLIPTGIFAFFQIPVDSLFITALLTVLGFSVHDTIVVFDRVRENLRKQNGSFETIVGHSLKETIVRSINTSMTTILALVAVYFFGGASTKNLALTLILGIAIGTYSSIFIASPLLVTYEKWSKRKK